jgi:hypothetical protein
VQPAPASLAQSLSSYSGDGNAADYHDCDVSPIFLKGEPPWGSTNTDSAFLNARGNAMIRYKEKKKARMYAIFYMPFQASIDEISLDCF